MTAPNKAAHTPGPSLYILSGPTRRLETVRREDCAEYNDQGTAVGMPLVKARDYDALATQNAALLNALRDLLEACDGTAIDESEEYAAARAIVAKVSP